MSHFLTFKEISKEQLNPNLVGGKANVLALLYQKGFLVPNGFVITTEFFNSLPNRNLPIEFSDMDAKEILDYVNRCSPKGLVAVRSSASVEDSNNQSFAGQFDSFLNVKNDQVLEAVKKCWQSLFNARAQSYAQGKNESKKMAVIVQDMIISDISGVAFSTHPVTGDQNSMIIEAVFGSNELLVQGAITPDYYSVSDKFEILDKKIVPQDEVYKQKLSDDQILDVAHMISDVSRLLNADVDVEWAIENRKLYILQSRPITAIQNTNAKNIF